MAISDSVSISTFICVEDKSTKTVPGCKVMNEGICIVCEDEGFYPVKINND